MFGKILVGLDGSDASWRAFEKGLALARTAGAELHVITVEELPARRAEKPDDLPYEEAHAEERMSGDFLMEARHRGLAAGVEVYGVGMEGHEVRSILAVAERGRFDLLIVGRTGHSKSFPDQAGSTATMLMLRAPCAFLAVP